MVSTGRIDCYLEGDVAILQTIVWATCRGTAGTTADMTYVSSFRSYDVEVCANHTSLIACIYQPTMIEVRNSICLQRLRSTFQTL